MVNDPNKECITITPQFCADLKNQSNTMNSLYNDLNKCADLSGRLKRLLNPMADLQESHVNDLRGLSKEMRGSEHLSNLKEASYAEGFLGTRDVLKDATILKKSLNLCTSRIQSGNMVDMTSREYQDPIQEDSSQRDTSDSSASREDENTER